MVVSNMHLNLTNCCYHLGCCYTLSGGPISVGRATPEEEVLGSIPNVTARNLLIGSVSVLCDLLSQKSWSPRSISCVAARTIWLGARPRYNLVVDEDIKKPTQTKLDPSAI